MTNFKVGQKVVCVDDSPGAQDGHKALIKNNVYTVRRINQTGKGIELVEIPDSACPLIRVNENVQKFYPYWRKNRFKPLVEYISISATLASTLTITRETSDCPVLNPNPQPHQPSLIPEKV